MRLAGRQQRFHPFPQLVVDAPSIVFHDQSHDVLSLYRCGKMIAEYEPESRGWQYVWWPGSCDRYGLRVDLSRWGIPLIHGRSMAGGVRVTGAGEIVDFGMSS
jgi:hypothetical protein